MPQLDIYTFSTQIYLVGIVSFCFLILFSFMFTYVLFFESEMYESDQFNLGASNKNASYGHSNSFSYYQHILNRLTDSCKLLFNYKIL